MTFGQKFNHFYLSILPPRVKFVAEGTWYRFDATDPYGCVLVT